MRKGRGEAVHPSLECNQFKVVIAYFDGFPAATNATDDFLHTDRDGRAQKHKCPGIGGIYAIGNQNLMDLVDFKAHGAPEIRLSVCTRIIKKWLYQRGV